MSSFTKTNFILIFASLFIGTNSFAEIFPLKEELIETGITFDTEYIGEYWRNTSGGLTKEGSYLSHMDIGLGIDTEKTELWNDGLFYLHLISNHSSKKLSADIVGDLQTASNIEAPRTTRVYEIWYDHMIRKDLSLLVGVHDYNSEFNVTDWGSLYINSSFGINSNMSQGARLSIFPLAAPAVRVKYSPQEDLSLLFGVYDGNPDNPEDVEHFPRFDFDKDGGAFITTEIFHLLEKDADHNLPNAVKVGAWYNTGEFSHLTQLDDLGNPIIEKGNYGGYVIIDKTLLSVDENEGLGAFLQISASPDKFSEVDFYVGAGLNYRGLFMQEGKDEIGFACAYASISDTLINAGGRDDAETTLELTYKASLNDHLTLQPDIQYVIDPGANQTTKNALIAGMRFVLTL